jgi:hypothetical protein
MTDQEPQTAPSGRTLRRLRAQFRRELLGDAKPAPSDLALIDLAAQAALRVREMRTQIAAGSRVPDEDLVRISNAVNRIMREFRGRAAAKADKRSLTYDERMAAWEKRNAERNASEDNDDL